MFEISGNDITNLCDSDLRSLAARLALAELRAKGYPRSSVTAGGNQDAADGGLDVRVECPSEFSDPDFVPRRLTGFQVKKPDMGASAIRKEMRPKGVLREVIRELADGSGAYVIVCSQGSVTDKPLAARRKAMRDALSDVPNASQLHTDFYDRERLAYWANEYPGIAAWVRSKVGRPLSGWSGIGDWEGCGIPVPKPYLFNDKACLIDERSREREHLTIAEGIARIRAGLQQPRQCIRLIGLSGNGKTRLVQALFEEGVGVDPLDLSLAVYTDYSEATIPTARDMARELIAQRHRAILVVDNCNPSTHSELAQLCAGEASQVSLITVEYDVREDEPEQTDVFRLQSASPELVTEWIKQSFPDISQVDRGKIAEFSDGNFRVARALAETLEKGETLGSLKSRELFERIFRQRNEPDRQLLQAAEDLSLLYSIDGEDELDGSELAIVGSIRGVGPLTLFEALAEMRYRGVVQARGRFRAILPQAIANPLAAHALERISPARFDQICRSLTPRMRKSMSRRLGFLHDYAVAKATVERWLRADGPVGNLIEMGEDGLHIVTNIAPVSPEAVLEWIEKELNLYQDNQILAPERLSRNRWIQLIKLIGYDANLFDRAVALLSRIASTQIEGAHNPAITVFSECFQIHLSGTRATPEQRRAAIRRLATSQDEGLRRTAHIALSALLKTGPFMSMGSYDFGARSRDWGWYPCNEADISEWFVEAVSLVIELSSEWDARLLLASSIRGLWNYPGCRDALDRAATVFSQTRPWIEGWVACRAALRYVGKDLAEDDRAELEKLISRLKPTDLLNQARAVVINKMSGGGSCDYAEGEDDEGDIMKSHEKAQAIAKDLGVALAHDSAVRAVFIAELLVEPQSRRALECGRGLAEGANDLYALWLELITAYGMAEAPKRDATVLCGFIHAGQQRAPDLTAKSLEDAIQNADLLPMLPYLQAWAGLDADGIARLRRAIQNGGLVASNFHCLANGLIAKSPSEELAALLDDIATLPNGIEVSLAILHMHFYCNREKGLERNNQLVSVGRDLLSRADFSRDRPINDYGAHQVISICLVGEAGRKAAKMVCEHIRVALENHQVSSLDLTFTLKVLFEIQPLVALDSFLLSATMHPNSCLFDMDRVIRSPVESLELDIVKEWASHDPESRYPLLGRNVSMFIYENGEARKEISPFFLSLLEQAPDKQLFFGDIWHRLHPLSGNGSISDLLEQRKTQVMKLADHPNKQVRDWVSNVIPELDGWIKQHSWLDREREESFE